MQSLKKKGYRNEIARERERETAVLSLVALELESIEPGRNGLGDIVVEVNKVLCAAIELNDPAGDIDVDKLALGRVLEDGELRRSTQDVAVAAVNRAVGEAR